MIACELSLVTIPKMGRGELISIDVLYRIETKLDVDFCDMMSIKKKIKFQVTRWKIKLKE